MKLLVPVPDTDWLLDPVAEALVVTETVEVSVRIADGEMVALSVLLDDDDGVAVAVLVTVSVGGGVWVAVIVNEALP